MNTHLQVVRGVQGQVRIEHGVSELERGQVRIERGVSEVECGQVRIEYGVSEVERRVLEIGSQINVSWH